MVPRRAGKPCRIPGCPAIVHGVSYCKQHAREIQAAYDAKRGSPSQRGYGRNWRRLRGIVLARSPLCADPFHIHGDDPPVATDVDHIVPRRQGGRDTFDNLQTLCSHCHKRKTAEETFR